MTKDMSRTARRRIEDDLLTLNGEDFSDLLAFMAGIYRAKIEAGDWMTFYSASQPAKHVTGISRQMLASALCESVACGECGTAIATSGGKCPRCR